MGALPKPLPERLVDRLARASAPESARLLRAVPKGSTAAWSTQIADDVPQRARANLEEGRRLAEAALWLAERSDDPVARARALRADGHSLALRARYRAAFARYRRAAALLEAAGDEVQLAVTFSGAVQTLIYLGLYDRAHEHARRARAIFKRCGDRVRLARLESNVGNIYFRQDRFAQALACYQRAAAEMHALGEHQDVAVALRNMAVSFTSLNRFDAALETYREARRYGEEHGLRLLVAEADYNVAYVYFLCGDYERALRAYGEARTLSDKLGDRYHRALCDLDEAEVCLELNDHAGARRLAEEAAAGFVALGMRYERAKALVFLATAEARHGNGARALSVYSRARALFLADRNSPWIAAVDLARALELFHMERFSEAAGLATRAGRQALSPTLRVLRDLLQARLALRTGDLRRARAASQSAMRRFRDVQAPALEWQVHKVAAQVKEAAGDPRAAEACYQRARKALEALRAGLTIDELKVPFLADKLGVYESLVHLALVGCDRDGREKTAFYHIEEAKSRSLVELLAFRAPGLLARAAAAVPAQQVRLLRRQLRADERRIAHESMRPHADLGQLRRMRAAASGRAQRLSAALEALQASDADLASLQTGAIADPDAIRSALPPRATLVEYYTARGTVYACVLARDRLNVVPLARQDEVANTLRLLRFQLAKFQLGHDYVRTFSSVLSAATNRHLQDLHALLVAPLRPHIDAAELIVVPHGPLHYLPFHALFDGGRYLMDEYTISYAPSATVYHLCQRRSPSPHHRSLVMALADGYAPHIRREAEEVGGVLPDVRVYTGEEATLARLRGEAGACRLIHIATHGLFRRENPMLSSVRLADGELAVADLYDLSLNADLVTLSGCGTGLNAVVGGDELIGLMRGLLYAGTRSLLLTMWQVDDFSTAEFMGSFYRHLVNGRSMAQAVGMAMKAIRERFPHPYYWAPFILVGHSAGDGEAGRAGEPS